VSWPLSILVALLTGGVGLLGAGFVAALIVDWYRISSFEGGSGFFVVFMALFGGMAGSVLGLIAARVTAARPNPGFGKGLRNAVGAAVVILVAVAGVARVLADVPPQIDGQTLLLHVELRSPAGDTTDLAALSGTPYVRLGALAPFSNVQRVSDQGPLWIEDVRREDSRWIVPGAVEIVTSRGKKVLDIGVGDTMLGGFLIPLRGSPSRADLDWTPWYPQAPAGEAPLPDQFTYRYRVARQSDSVRTAAAGPFAIDHLITGFYPVMASDRMAANTEFAVRHRGQLVAGLERAVAVAVVGGPTPALLVRTEDETRTSTCHLAVARDDQVTTATTRECADPAEAAPLTSDAAVYTAARRRVHVPGWVDRETFARAGLYLIRGVVLDTRNLTLRQIIVVGPNGETRNPNVPPLGISPDERSIAWWAITSEDQPFIGVTDTVDGKHARLPVDRARMRVASFGQLDPAWLLHHFAWVHGPDGVDRLEARTDVTPLPYRGEYSNVNDYSHFKLEPAGKPLRAAIEEWLVDELKAEARPGNQPGAFSHTFRVDGEDINVMFSDGSDYVSLAMPAGETDKTGLIRRIGERLNEKLATGAWDDLFGR
jgi:hypothetical protein